MGPVNLAAIDELKEVEARRDFLVGHQEDLTQARETLSEIIDHINTESRRKFMRTYKDVRRGFQDLFRKLYSGGKADMVLQMDEGNDDPLEAGIEIIAQPPGKQPKSITLLSGGEKALTAIALLFAVYQTKPSPFCILDEVDAPLDESNTDVYCQMVKEFCDRSQFLVITHNKRTMQFADAIYGITQYERGISTKISVKLDDIEKVGSDGNVDQVAEGPISDTVRGQGPFAEVAMLVDFEGLSAALRTSIRVAKSCRCDVNGINRSTTNKRLEIGSFIGVSAGWTFDANVSYNDLHRSR